MKLECAFALADLFEDEDEERLTILLTKHSRQTICKLEDKMNCSYIYIYIAIDRHINAMGFTQKLATWVPHKLSERGAATMIGLSLVTGNRVPMLV